MGFASMKTFAVLQLLLLLLGSFNALINAHAPVPSPAPQPTYHAPSPSPVYAPPPRHPPSDAPSNHPPSKPVAVQGMVYCKSCKYSGVDTLTGATPISGAIVKLRCHNTKHVKNVVAKTDKGGYFFLEAPHTVATYGVHKCTVSLFSSPLPSCETKTNINNGTEGATLRYEVESSYALYNVGPFAFEPSKC